MTDPPLRVSDASPRSAPAIISFVILAIFAVQVAGLFWLVKDAIKVDPLMAAILGGTFTTSNLGIGSVTGFWLANSMQSNRSNTAQAAVIAQQAGSGPPPPAPAQPVAGAQA